MKKPSDFTKLLWDSVFQNSECETVFRNIMVILERTGNKWRNLSFEEYKAERLKDKYFNDVEEKYFNQVVAYTINAEEAEKAKEKPKLPKENPLATSINVFFLREGYFSAILTTKETIETPFYKKITLELHNAKKWKSGTSVGYLGACAISERGLLAYNDENYHYILTTWHYNHKEDKNTFIPIPKYYTSGDEYKEDSLEEASWLFI